MRKFKLSWAVCLCLPLFSLFTNGCVIKTSETIAGASVTPAVPPAPPTTALPLPLPAPATHDDKMAWFREAKYGLFIHWGLYCIPAGEWNGREVPGLGEWIMNREQIPVAEYSQLAGLFNPIDFNAEAWVQMAEDAGMKYIVITSKHHDGFAMYHSLVSPYNIFDATPFHRDPIRELAEACARHHIKFGFYYSQAQDWHEPGGAGNTWDFGPDEAKDNSGAYDHYLRTKAEPQVKELLSGYGPVCLIWFDTPRMMTGARGQRFVDIVHSMQPACLIDGRLGADGDYTSTGDNAIPHAPLAGDWETPATVNHTWGFKKNDTDWKSPGEILFKLVDIASKGGNYLLNVGPTSLGVIPSVCQSNLLTVGRWLKVNGDAIYGAGPSPFGEEFGATSGLKDAGGKPAFLEFMDWRCTSKPGRLYFTLFKMPRDGFVLPAFRNDVFRAYFLNDPAQINLPITRTNNLRIVETGRTGTDPMANVLVVETVGEKIMR